jgi:uncharacterized protein (TIGR03000 family)
LIDGEVTMIRRLLMPTALLLTFALLSLPAPAQDKDKAKTPVAEKGEKKSDAKIVTLKVLVPQANTKLTVEGQVTKLTGETRTFRSPPLEPGVKYVYTLIAEWEPNNYTKIKRTIKKNVEAGLDVEIDFRKANPDIPDDILVRYVPTPDDIVEKMVEMAKIGKDDVVYDLGCGDGRMVIAAVKKGGAKRGVGIDIDPQRVAESKANAKQAGVEDKVEFREGDVLKIPDLSDANVVLLYMGEDLNRQLKPILQKTLKPGSRIVSHRFTMGPDWKTDRTETIRGKDGDTYLLHLWTIKETKKDEAKKEEAKKEDVKKDEPKKDEPKKDGAKKDK